MPNKISPKQEPQEDFEEVQEKKTSKLGYFLLMLMAIFLLIVGQKIFSDLGKIPERPQSPANCLSRFEKIDNLKSLVNPPNCLFNEVDKKFDLDQKFYAIEPALETVVSLNAQIRDLNNQIKDKENEIKSLEGQYDLSLQEKIAQEAPIMAKESIKNSITSLRSQITSLNSRVTTLSAQRDQELNNLSLSINSLYQAYKGAQEYYKNKQAYYNLIIFLVKFIFILPVFVLAVYFYLRLKRKNSPYTIILAFILGASSILFLQVMLVFLYHILPMEWLKRIFKFLMEMLFIRYVIYYIIVILIILIFGGIVYYIQKKVFNPQKVAIRRLKDNKCPGCSFTLNPEHNFCPKCGQKLKEKCPSCGRMRIYYLSHCPFCGK